MRSKLFWGGFTFVFFIALAGGKFVIDVWEFVLYFSITRIALHFSFYFYLFSLSASKLYYLFVVVSDFMFILFFRERVT